MRDVCVVGAGPVGTFLAKKLAQRGLRVTILEEHEEIGVPVHCTGVIGASSFEKYNLPDTARLNTIQNIKFISPQNHAVTLSKPRPWAHIVCRTKLDSALAEEAREAGVDVICHAKVSDVKEEANGVQIFLKDKRTFRAKACVLATGSMCNLPYRLGFYRPWYFLKAAQIETEVEVPSLDTVEAYLGKSVCGGEFIWIAPATETRIRIGVFSRKSATQFLQTFMNRESIKERVRQDYRMKAGVIPVGGIDFKKLVHQRIFTVGDAAGQVKPTSAGGIVYGMMCAELLTDNLLRAFHNEALWPTVSKRYYRQVRRKFGFEMLVGDFFRKLFSTLEDEHWDRVLALAQDPKLLQIIHHKADFDKHSKIIRWALGHKDYRKIFFANNKLSYFQLLRQGAYLWF